jgi:peptidoglycan/xylan/chitin deacetylase (PgdA/CDA1 family)
MTIRTLIIISCILLIYFAIIIFAVTDSANFDLVHSGASADVFPSDEEDITKESILPQMPSLEKLDYIIQSDTLDLERPIVALTFDDGPRRYLTDALLDELSKRNIRVTFFVLGITAANSPATLTTAVTMGNQIGTHGYDHIKRFTTLGAKGMMDQIDRSLDSIKDACSITPHLLRPPYGSINKNLAEASNLPVILWNIDPCDWKPDATAETVSQHIIEYAEDGSIIILHDIHEIAIEATIIAIDILMARGFQFVTIDELFAAKNIDLIPGQIYYNAK